MNFVYGSSAVSASRTDSLTSIHVAIKSTKIQIHEGVYDLSEAPPIKVSNFFFFFSCSCMYLITRILFLSRLMTHLLKQIPTCFMLKLFSRKSLVYQSLPGVPEIQSPDPSHKRTRSTGSRSSQEPQLKKAWISRQNKQKSKLKSSVGNYNLKWKTNLWPVEKAETEIGCTDKVLRASRQRNWCST